MLQLHAAAARHRVTKDWINSSLISDDERRACIQVYRPIHWPSGQRVIADVYTCCQCILECGRKSANSPDCHTSDSMDALRVMKLRLQVDRKQMLHAVLRIR